MIIISFTFYGRIVANGTVTDSIKFTPLSAATGWHGLRFYDGNISSLSANEISYCQFEQGYGLGEDDDKNGGAIFCSNTSNLTIENSYFFQNYCEWDGGAVYLENSSSVNINDCMFLMNDCGFYGGSITVYGVSTNLIMANVLFVNNETQFGSGAACGITNCTTEAINITAVDNVSPLSGGAFWVNGGTLNLYNSILWNNLPEDIFILDGTANVSNSCISDGSPGTFVISDDPQFINYAELDLHLSEISPCIDTGDETLVSFPLPNFDLDGNERIIDGDENGTVIIDMGAYEFVPEGPSTGFIVGTVTNFEGDLLENAEITAGTYSALTDINGEYEIEVEAGDYTVSCYLEGYQIPDNIEITVIASETSIVDFVLEEEVGINNQLLVSDLTIIGNYPNPFNPSTTISFALPNPSITSVKVYNAKGQIVKDLIHDFLSIGQHDIVWNGTDGSGKQTTSGIYFYTIKTETQTGKMLMLK